MIVQESINIAISIDMDVKTHWEKVYQAKAPNAVSSYKPHLEISLNLIERTSATPFSAIIDVGAGESTLADDLLSLEFQNITVLDISETAIDVCKKRMGAAAKRVHWLVAEATSAVNACLVLPASHEVAVAGKIGSGILGLARSSHQRGLRSQVAGFRLGRRRGQFSTRFRPGPYHVVENRGLANESAASGRRA
jgi:hypothetical protein